MDVFFVRSASITQFTVSFLGRGLCVMGWQQDPADADVTPPSPGWKVVVGGYAG
jgi:hypothetical protein